MTSSNHKLLLSLNEANVLRNLSRCRLFVDVFQAIESDSETKNKSFFVLGKMDGHNFLCASLRGKEHASGKWLVPVNTAVLVSYMELIEWGADGELPSSGKAEFDRYSADLYSYLQTALAQPTSPELFHTQSGVGKA